MQAITTIGLDIAKSVFQIHGVDAAGNVIVRRKLKRRYVLSFFQKLPACRVGIEACASSHHWSRELQALGHTVRLMPPAYVTPYVKRQKNDAADAEAICEAVTRANMRFVATKTFEQQSCLMLPSHPPSVHSPADRSDQCDPRASCGVWHRRTGRPQWS
jgi:transposase